ncbi:single-stranded-DNA-specific exonuclease RecJ [bacterium]|nr:single-stranded-DNA-specific exonuclease RecJ [bacterium]
MQQTVSRDALVEKAEKELENYPELTKKLLLNREIFSAEEAEKFLNPDFERDVGDPFKILNMERAVERILRAIGQKEKIVVYGDYDMDGIPGSVILHDFFKKIGYEHFKNYIPHRQDEGYGLNNAAIESFAQDGVSLVVTVDCGISDVAEVAHANELGLDVIITDHHLPQEELPPAYAVINSKQKEDTYHDDMLCGAGVAWKLVQGLLRKGNFGVPEGWEKWLLDMAGLSTIADMVPLKRENRAIAYYGLKVLKKSRRPGLVSLMHKAGIAQPYATEDDVGFLIGPRINAASRLDHPLRAFELLSTGDEAEGAALADHLQKINDRRKALVASIMKELKASHDMVPDEKLIVTGNPDWIPGILGLVANRLMEDRGAITFVWGRGNGGVIKGSCRSNGTVNLVELMSRAEPGTFLDFGGHEASGGFSADVRSIHLLPDALRAAYEKTGITEKKKEISIDDALSLEDVSWERYREIERFAPFGIGNPKPHFMFKGIAPESMKQFGKVGDHLELAFRSDSGRRIRAIGFFMSPGDFGADIRTGNPIDLVASFEYSVFRDIPELRLRIARII